MGTGWYSECQGICADLQVCLQKKDTDETSLKKSRRANFVGIGRGKGGGMVWGVDLSALSLAFTGIIFDCSVLVSQGAPLAANSK